MVYYKTIKDFYLHTPKPLVLLGIDYGKKKIGLSISNQNNTLALRYKTIYQGPTTIDDLAQLVQELSITGIVIGYPLETSGNEGSSCQEVLKFCDKVLQSLPIPIFLQDERFSTKIIGQGLRASKTKIKKIIQLEDSLAAAAILQTALDQISFLS